MTQQHHATCEIKGATSPEYLEILTAQAQEFLAALATKFEGKRQECLAHRVDMQKSIEQGNDLDFPPETAEIRESDWTVASIPADVQDRRVEITGPVDRKMVINALNSGANVFMADFEDSNSPTWDNNLNGQINMRDAVRGTIEFTNEKGKHYKLNEKHAVLMVRPRGWHLVEKGFLVDGKPISGSLFDFGLFFFHNAKALLENGSGPYFYLPKLEHYNEAKLWNDVFVFAQDYVGVPQGTIRATVLIETITAAFQMDEILYQLKDHSLGLNCGRWDYIFSYIKRHRSRPDFVVPNRAQVGMTCHFLNSYVERLIKICHRRGTFAMGGMAAQIPIKNDPEANQKAMDKVRADKLREVKAGHDGTWVAHPGLIPLAKEIFDEHMPEANQISNKREEVSVTAADLLKVPTGTITFEGLRVNIDVGIRYLEAWLRGNGCVPIYNLMEDAATAEISRTQVWQWVRHGAKLEDGRVVTGELVKSTMDEVVKEISESMGDSYKTSKFQLASELFLEMMTGDKFPEFLTLAAYEHI
ncbi:MAG TPA: malate synthase A [Phycisphaerales bacterium]|nr:malate synthase A [Phycisphaerales bacterium]